MEPKGLLLVTMVIGLLVLAITVDLATSDDTPKHSEERNAGNGKDAKPHGQ
ncbi:MAG: hypothetical protein PHI97_29565 [Desulfobulbus sp.]|nr:hypothetical protein [Desulfobulbus sp.]